MHFVLIYHKKEEEGKNNKPFDSKKPPTQCHGVILPPLFQWTVGIFFPLNFSFLPQGRGSSVEGRWSKDVLVECFYCVFGRISLFLSGLQCHRQPAVPTVRHPATSSNRGQLSPLFPFIFHLLFFSCPSLLCFAMKPRIQGVLLATNICKKRRLEKKTSAYWQ